MNTSSATINEQYMKIVQQCWQQTKISEIFFDNKNKLDVLKRFAGCIGNVNGRVSPLCLRYLTSVCYVLNGLHFK